jgi:hypothetical protein
MSRKADASRVYGLELEHICHQIKSTFVYEETLIEEHIMGIPGDVFIKTLLDDCSDTEKSQIAKSLLSLMSVV